MAKPNDERAPRKPNAHNSLETGEGSRPAGRGEVGTDATSPLEHKRKACPTGGLTLDCFPNRRPKGYEQSFLELDENSFRYGRYSCRGINDGHFSQGRQTKFQVSGQIAVVPPTSLDNIDVSRHGPDWSVKQRRYFQRLLSGIKVAEFRDDVVRFLTLTSSPSSNASELNRHFENLVERIRRGYFLSEEERKRRKKPRKMVRFEYCKIATNEGYGVLHVIFIVSIFHKNGFLKRGRNCMVQKLCMLKNSMVAQRGLQGIWLLSTLVYKRQRIRGLVIRVDGSVGVSSSVGDISGKNWIVGRVF